MLKLFRNLSNSINVENLLYMANGEIPNNIYVIMFLEGNLRNIVGLLTFKIFRISLELTLFVKIHTYICKQLKNL